MNKSADFEIAGSRWLFSNFKLCIRLEIKNKRLASSYWGFCSSFTRPVVMFVMMDICVELLFVYYFHCVFQWHVSANGKTADYTFTEKHEGLFP